MIIKRFDTLDFNNLKENIPKYIILHSTRKYSEFEDVLKNHKKDRGWNGLGYHLFLSDSLKITQGRPYNVEGAHSLGFNTSSIGLCIQSNDEIISEPKIELGKKLITSLKNEFGDLEILSHTQSQIKYTNELLQKYNFNIHFYENVLTKEEFNEVKKEIDFFVGTLGTSTYGELKNKLKSIKFCPGESFNRFI